MLLALPLLSSVGRERTNSADLSRSVPSRTRGALDASASRVVCWRLLLVLLLNRVAAEVLFRANMLCLCWWEQDCDAAWCV